jgi:hypothetical protein
MVFSDRHLDRKKREMTIAHFALAIWRKLRRDGVSGLLRSGLKILQSKNSASEFDDEFGTDTEGVVPLWRLRIRSDNRTEGIRYQTVDPNLLRTVIGGLPIRFEDFVFVDLGSGKGRALLIASEHPFKQVIGIEFSEELHITATANICKYPKADCQRVTSLNVDAAGYGFPAENLVIYLYHPFGERVFRQVIANLERSLEEHNRKAWIIYFNPKLASILDASALWNRVNLSALAAIYMH